MSETGRRHVGAYALCVRDNSLLLVRMSPNEGSAGMWTLPGGGLNWGEAPEDGALRELTEETGLSGRVSRLAGVFSHLSLGTPDRPRYPFHHIGIVYFVDASPGEIRNEQGGSTDLCTWVPLEDVEALPLVPLAEYGLRLLHGPAAADDLRDLHGSVP